MMNKTAFFSFAFISAVMLHTSAVYAQGSTLEAPATDSSEQTPEESDSMNYRSKKYLNLTAGFEEVFKLPALPKEVVFKGTYRNVVSIDFDKKLNLLRINPKSEGYATLSIHDKKNGKVIAEYRIDVKKSKLDKVVREIRALLSDVEGITIKVVNNKVIVDGQVLLPRDYSRILNVIGQFGDQAASLVTISPLAQKKIAEFIAKDINNPEITVRAVNDKVILEGYASSEDERAKAEIIAKMYLPPVVIDPAASTGAIKVQKPANDGVINLIAVKEAPPAPPEKMVQLVVHYVELKKDYSKSFRFDFSPTLDDKSNLTVTTGNNGGGVVSQLTGVVSRLLPKLNWAKTHGHARILESTSLIVQDGKKGELAQETDQPYTAIGKDGTPGVATTKTGITTVITPVILGEKSGSVRLDMQFKIAALTGVSQEGQPIVTSNNINSVITVRDRQSAAVGGLIKNSTNTGYNRNPASGAIISLYASKDFQRDQSQFVVFVTPIIKTSASSGSEQVKKKFRLKE